MVPVMKGEKKRMMYLKLDEIAEEGYYSEIVTSGPYYAVLVGDEGSIAVARALELKLQQLGYDTLIVTA